MLLSNASAPPPDPRLRPPRLLVITPALPPAAGRHAAASMHLAWRLALRDLDVRVLTADRGGLASHYPFDLFTPVRHWDWTAQKPLIREIEHQQPDAVLLLYSGRGYGPHPLPTLIPSLIKRAMPDVPVVTHLESGPGANPARLSIGDRARARLLRDSLRGDVDFTWGTLLSVSDHVMVASDLQIDDLAMHHPPLCTKVSVLATPPCMAIQGNRDGRARRAARRELKIEPHETLLVHAAGSAPGCGAAVAIQSLAHLLRRRRHVKLAIIDDVSPESSAERKRLATQLRVLAVGLDVDRSIRWIDGADPHRVSASRALWAGDVAVLSWDEGLSTSQDGLAAAVVHGLPLVATRPQRMESDFEAGQNVQLAPPRNPRALADAIEEVLSDAALRGRLIQGVAALRRDWPDWDRMATRLLPHLGFDMLVEDEAPLALAA